MQSQIGLYVALEIVIGSEVVSLSATIHQQDRYKNRSKIHPQRPAFSRECHPPAGS